MAVGVTPLHTTGRAKAQGWRISLMRAGFYAGGADAYGKALALQVAALHAAVHGLEVHRATLTRVGDREMGIRPPFGSPDVVVAAVREADIAEHYADPAAFCAAWHTVEQIDGLTLVSRNRAWVDDDSFNLAAYATAVALARAAKAGKTEYFLPLLSEEDEAALEDTVQIKQVGYDDEARSLEFAVVLGEGRHLNWADVFTILTFLEEGVGDGSPVDTVKVTFVDRAAAKAEAGLLEDMGVVVQYYARGKIQTLR